MDKFIFTVLFLLLNQALLAQDADDPKVDVLTITEVQQPPLPKKCKSKWEIERQKNCSASFINNFINQRFDIELAKKLGVNGMLSMQADFIINKAGIVENISATGGPEKLNNHFVDIIKALPRFKPALENGEAVSVSIHLPISMYIVP